MLAYIAPEVEHPTPEVFIIAADDSSPKLPQLAENTVLAPTVLRFIETLPETAVKQVQGDTAPNGDAQNLHGKKKNRHWHPSTVYLPAIFQNFSAARARQEASQDHLVEVFGIVAITFMIWTFLREQKQNKTAG